MRFGLFPAKHCELHYMQGYIRNAWDEIRRRNDVDVWSVIRKFSYVLRGGPPRYTPACSPTSSWKCPARPREPSQMFFNSLDWTYYQNGPPGGVKSLLRSTDPNLDVLRCEFLNLGQKTVPKAQTKLQHCQQNNPAVNKKYQRWKKCRELSVCCIVWFKVSSEK